MPNAAGVHKRSDLCLELVGHPTYHRFILNSAAYTQNLRSTILEERESITVILQ